MTALKVNEIVLYLSGDVLKYILRLFIQCMCKLLLFSIKILKYLQVEIN